MMRSHACVEREMLIASLRPTSETLVHVRFYYQALLAEDIHVAVLRPGKVKFYEEEQLSLLSRSYRAIRAVVVSAEKPQLMACTASGVRSRSIDELVEEFDRGQRLP